MQDRAFRTDKIAFRWDSVVVDVLGDQRVTGLLVKDVTRARSRSPADGSSSQSARSSSELFAGQLETDEAGYLVTREGREQTSRRFRVR